MQAILRGSTQTENIGDRLMSAVAATLLRDVGVEKTYRLTHWDRRYDRRPAPRRVAALFDLGNVYYCDSWPEPVAKRIRESIRFNRAFRNAAIVYLPCGWGPYRREDFELLVELTRDAVVFARDRASLGYLDEALGPDRGRFCPDLGLLCEAEETQAGAELLRKLGVSFRQPLLGLIPNVRCTEAGVTPLDDPAAYHDQLSRVVAWGRRNSFAVVGISHTVDTIRDRRLLEGLGIPVLRSDSPRIVRSVVGNLSAAVCSRYHGLVSCLVQGVPPISLGWQHKYRGLMEQFDLLEFDQPLSGAPAELDVRLDSLAGARDRLVRQIRDRRDACREQIRAEMGWLSSRLGGPPNVLAGPIRIGDCGIDTVPLAPESRTARMLRRAKRLVGYR